MSWSLLAPVGLFGLLALVVPLLIHLSRRSRAPLVEFAALRWITREVRPQRRPRFEERVLLALRLAMIALLSLWWAQPAREIAPADAPVLALWPGATAPSSTDAYSRVLHLRPGFPSTSAGEAPADCGWLCTPSSLLRELDAQLSADTELHVRVPEQLDGLDPETLRLGRATHWEIDAHATVQTPAHRTPLKVALRSDSSESTQWNWMRAALHALAETTDGPAAIELQSLDAGEPIPPLTDVLIWASDGPIDSGSRQWLQQGGRLLAAAGSAGFAERGPAWTQPPISQRQGESELRLIAAAPTPESYPIVLDPGFPTQVMRWIERHGFEPGRAQADAVAPMQQRMDRPVPRQPAGDLLPVLLLLLLACERWLATRPRSEPDS